MHFIPNDKTVRSILIQALKGFNSQSSTTQAKKAEQLDAMTDHFATATFWKGFWYIGWWNSGRIYRERNIEK